MGVKFVNDLQTRIADVGGIAAAATQVNITAGDGAKIAAFVDFPAGEHCYATFKNVSGNRETVKITNRAGDLLTIVRAADGDSARDWAQDDILDFCLCSAALNDIVADSVAESAAALASHTADDHHIAAETVSIFGQNSPPTGWTRKSDWQDNAMLCYAASGTPVSGGSANPQSGHTHSGGTLQFPFGSWYFNSSSDWGLSFTYGTPGVSVKLLQAGAAAASGSNPVATFFNQGASYDLRTQMGATGSSGANDAPYYQEVIAATKDAYA